MRPQMPVGLALLLLALAFCVGGCGTTNTYDGGPNHPCGPTMEMGRYFHEHFLEWTPEGAELVFDYRYSMYVVNTDGTRLRKLVQVSPSRNLRFGFHADISPDGERIVYSTCEFQSRDNNDYEIAIINIDGTGKVRLTDNAYAEHYSEWSPDGSRIAFVAEAQDIEHIYVGLYLEDIEFYTMKADGTDVNLMASTIRELPAEGNDNQQPIGPSESDTEEHKRVHSANVTGSFKEAGLFGVTLAPAAWSPNGKRLALLVNEGPYLPFQRVLYTVQIDGSGVARIAENVVSGPSWSPNGQRLAVAKTVGNDVALFTLAADGSDPKRITTITDRRSLEDQYGRYKTSLHTVSWSPDGTHILYTCDFGACVINLDEGSVVRYVQGLKQTTESYYISAWSPDGSRIAIYTPGAIPSDVPAQLFTVARDGTDRRDLIRLDDDGNLVPANPPQVES